MQLLDSGGTILTTLATITSDDSESYALHSYNVLPWAGQAVTVKFNSTATGLRTSMFAIDDTALNTS